MRQHKTAQVEIRLAFGRLVPSQDFFRRLPGIAIREGLGVGKDRLHLHVVVEYTQLLIGQVRYGRLGSIPAGIQ